MTAWDGRVAVCFDEVVGATEYTVQWRPDTEAYSEDRQKTVFETSETMDCGEGRLSTTVHRLANETPHWFRLRASNLWWDEGVQRKDSIWSAEVTATPTAKPAAPANLVVMPADGRLDVSWDAVEGADRYTVEWRQSGTVREREETTQAAALTGLVNGTTYSLRVQAANEVGEGPWSAPVRGRPDPLGHPPEVSITLGAGPPVDGALSVRVTFSEAVRGFEDGDLTAGYVGGPDVLVRGFEEEQTGLVYSAMVPAPQPGTLVISVGPGKAAAVSDTQGNVLGALVVEVGASGNAVAVSGPVVTGVLMSAQSGSGRQDGFGTRSVAARGSSGSGGSVRVTVTFSEPVTVDLVGGTPVIGLRLGEREREAPYAGGTETETVLFVYTVTGEDGSVTGGSVTPDSLELRGGTIRSWSGAEADLRHPGAALDGTGGDELPALTARFEAAPEAHDGAGTFTVRLVFSEPVATSDQTLRDESVSAAGGAVEGARRVEGRSDLWEITLTPASDEPVTLTLAAGRACDAAGAVCTADGRRLSNEAVLTVPGPAGDGPALTAQWHPGVFTDPGPCPRWWISSVAHKARHALHERGPGCRAARPLRDPWVGCHTDGVLAVSRLVGGTRLWSSILDRPDAAGGPALCVRTCRPGATGSGGSHDPAHAEATVGRGRRAVRLLHRDSGARCILLAVSLDARRCFRLRRSSLGLAGQPDRLLYPCGASGRPDDQTSL